MKHEHTFWMVKGDGPSSCIHHSFEAAKAEAQRLARANRGSEFYVMQAVRGYAVADVIERQLDADEIPL